MPWTIDPTSMGPVDVAVIGFADHAFRPELAAALREIVDDRTVRKLGELKQQGPLGDEEFAALKAKLIGTA